MTDRFPAAQPGFPAAFCVFWPFYGKILPLCHINCVGLGRHHQRHHHRLSQLSVLSWQLAVVSCQNRKQQPPGSLLAVDNAQNYRIINGVGVNK